MGGCRCTFRNCENSTSSRPGMHFFHFPIRDWDRLEIWASNADKLEFKNLPLSKLKNKVICQDHFENRMFMNYLMEGLVKTAIPTLETLDDGRVWNIETNAITDREEWVVPGKDSIDGDAGSAPSESQTTRMEIQFLDSDQEEFSITPVCEEPPEILNKASSPVPIKLSLAEKPKKTVPMTPPSNAVLRKVVIKRKNPSGNNSLRPSKMQVLSIHRIPKNSPTKAEVHREETVAEEIPSVATPSSSTDVSVEKSEPEMKEPPASPKLPPPPASPVVQIVTDPSYVEKLEQASTGIEELKKILIDVLNKPPPEPQIITVPVPTPAPQAEPSGNSSPKAEKGPHMNKVQLFNGIKRYLNPTMVAMLRMELFAGSAERQWKADEKTLAVELNNLGENVYDHFSDEFRFRLPSKKDVQKWKKEALDDDGDAS
ncbi:titin [Ochlerotatus camptorhynchus]|uniref:titin n=1 Tax=Ochlerotatus camptorhynchus TaxID=644619 RepID=UPI0031D14994